jgi:hypothetical protein
MRSRPGFNVCPFIPVPGPLTPTSLQELIPHPYVDIIPFPTIRNKILSSLPVVDEDQLCNDLREGAWSSGEMWPGIHWDGRYPSTSRKWWFLLDVRTTNFWRRQSAWHIFQLVKMNLFDKTGSIRIFILRYLNESYHQPVYSSLIIGIYLDDKFHMWVFSACET